MPFLNTLWKARHQIEWENSYLVPYAVRAGETRGRRYPEEEHPFKTPFERDRDRILHSRAFRLLEAKTQVFAKEPGEPYRTRLTHTLEVAQIARSVAHILRLNEDLTEAIALAHDLGHPPFGHTGEKVLNELTLPVGGFNHNRQSLRVVDFLEIRYHAFPGLNLTWEVREGLGKHGSGRQFLPQEFQDTPQPSLEAQIVDVCDEIAYNNHDLDDGLTSGLINLDQLEKVSLWQSVWQSVLRRAPRADLHIQIAETIRELINRQVLDLIEHSARRIQELQITHPDDARRLDQPIVQFSQEMCQQNQELKEFLNNHLYLHPNVEAAQEKALDALRHLWEGLYTGKVPLPQHPYPPEEKVPLERRIADYIANLSEGEVWRLASAIKGE